VVAAEVLHRRLDAQGGDDDAGDDREVEVGEDVLGELGAGRPVSVLEGRFQPGGQPGEVGGVQADRDQDRQGRAERDAPG
jgi:hypothetical protein